MLTILMIYKDVLNCENTCSGKRFDFAGARTWPRSRLPARRPPAGRPYGHSRTAFAAGRPPVSFAANKKAKTPLRSAFASCQSPAAAAISLLPCSDHALPARTLFGTHTVFASFPHSHSAQRGSLDNLSRRRQGRPAQLNSQPTRVAPVPSGVGTVRAFGTACVCGTDANGTCLHGARVAQPCRGI